VVLCRCGKSSFKLLINLVWIIIKLRLQYIEALMNQIRPGRNIFNEQTGSYRVDTATK
jgi:hypothetical protein